MSCAPIPGIRGIVLASASQRRRDLLAAIGMPCELSSADVDEASIPYKSPRELAIKAASAKALAVEHRYPEMLILAADTIVALGEQVYMKPSDEADARRMLGELAGHPHRVITGLAVTVPGKELLLDAVETTVHMRALSPAEIAEYVATGEPIDKAGAYAIQGIGRGIVERVEGDYHNVVGLPMRRLLDIMEPFLDVTSYRCRLESLPGW